MTNELQTEIDELRRSITQLEVAAMEPREVNISDSELAKHIKYARKLMKNCMYGRLSRPY